jgi:hypothetical protein
MISQYGLYNYPYHYKKAYKISKIFLNLSYETYKINPELFNEFGWIVPAIYLLNYPYQNKENTGFELAETAFIILMNADTPIEKESDFNSFKRVKSDYNKVLAEAYLFGSFGASINYKKGLSLASKIDKSYRND